MRSPPLHFPDSRFPIPGFQLESPMPELPEVETIVRDLRPHLKGRRFMHGSLAHAAVLGGVSRRALLGGRRGARVKSLSRRAKHAVIETDARRLVVQPGMTGSLLVREPPARGAGARGTGG